MKLLLRVFLGTIMQCPVILLAQPGFIRTNSSYLSVQIIRQKESLKSKEVSYFIKPDKKIIKAFPRDLTEYGFIKGDTYSRLNIGSTDSEQLVFAKRLSQEMNLSLYMVRTDDGTRFFAKKDEELVELVKGSTVQVALSELLTNCDPTPNWIHEVRFNQRSLTRAFSLHSKCYKGIFPRVRKGIMAGYSFNRLTLTGPDGEQVHMGTSASPLAGVFMDFPLGEKSAAWSVTVQAFYQKDSYHVSENTAVESVANTTSVTMPVSFKRHIGSGKVGKYFSAGPSISYYLTKDSYTYETTISGIIISEQKTEYDIAKVQLELALGTGLNFQVMKSNLLNVELKYLFGGTPSTTSSPGHSHSSVQLISSFSF